MKNQKEIFETLKSEFSDAIISIDESTPVEPIILVAPDKVNIISHFLRTNEELQFDSLMNLSGVDEANGTKLKNEDGSETISGGNLSIYYHLYSTIFKHKVTLKTLVERDNPEVESVYYVWRCSDWHEREAFDMYGIIFLNHPDLRRILMPYDWEAGYPLRKDYKNPEFYQGMKVPY
jgi:NADH-quinone oxidoreductase subunit C